MLTVRVGPGWIAAALRLPGWLAARAPAPVVCLGTGITRAARDDARAAAMRAAVALLGAPC